MRPLNISGSQAKDYYYGKDPIFDVQTNSQWHGQMAKEFELNGRCEEHDFINVISGNNPNGAQIIQDGVNKEHRAAIDIPLSAPKSVSVLALHVGDQKVIDAHHEAVEATIKYVENNYLYSRRTKEGVTEAFKTGNGLFATFTHSTSRANDPHLHTHTLTMNMTNTDAGYRAIFNDPIFKDQTLLNYVYQSELAKNVRQLGYGITNDAKGKWEIAGFKDEWVEQFSTRSKEIDAALEKTDGAGKEADAKTRDRAQKSSRADKDLSLSAEELKDQWQEKVSRETIQNSVEAAKETALQVDDKELTSGEYITTAYGAIHENESTFIRQDVVKIALELSRGNYTVADIEHAFYDAIKEQDIEQLRSHVNKKGLETVVYTSRDMRLTEQTIVDNFNKHKGQMPTAFKPETVKGYIEKEFNHFTEGQKKVVQNILTSGNRFNIIQGDAGTGKTTALKAIKDISDRAGRTIQGKDIEITGLGFTGKAAREVADRAGIDSRTLHSFLQSQAPEFPSDTRKVWLVDESSMVGSKQMESVIERAIAQDAQVFFIGDGKQLPAIPAGRMFKDLQAGGHVKVIKMEEAIRQKTDYMISAVKHVKDFHDGKSTTGIDDAFSLLDKQNRVHAISNKSDRIEAAARHLIDHPDRSNCLIVTNVNEDRVAANEVVHQALKPKDQAELNVAIHTPVYLNGTARYFAKNYNEGQRAFIETSRIDGLNAGQEVTISSVDVATNRVTFTNGDKSHQVDLKNGDVAFSVYDIEQRSFFEGEKVVFLKNDKQLDLSNGQTGTITKIGPEKVVSVNIHGQDREAKINLAFYPYIDRGYAVTMHKSQGGSAKDVVLVADSKHPSNKTESLYVALSRAENNFTFIADKPNQVKDQFKEAQPKTSTLEFVANVEKDISKGRSKSRER